MKMKARKADEKFLNRSLALKDLKAMDVDGDGKVGKLALCDILL